MKKRMTVLHLVPSSGYPTTSPGERSDDELMMLTRGGMRSAFDTLVRRHQADVMRFAARCVGSAASAADITQSTFVELYRYVPRYQARGSFRALLFRIAVNQCRMAFRSHARDRRRTDIVAATSLPVACGPEEQMLERERRREVERALANLRPKLREVVTLRFNAGLSYDEIATILRIPLGTVRSRLFAGLEKMRACLTWSLP